MFFHTAADYILWGGLLSLYVERYPEHIKKVVGLRLWLLGFVFFLVIAQPLIVERLRGFWMLPIGITLNSIGAAFFCGSGFVSH